MDLPVWQALYEELGPLGFTAITVALDKDSEDARPWIDAAKPTHPSLVDTRWATADLYNVINVPTVLWIDEDQRIVRPNDAIFGTDTFTKIHGIDPAPKLEALRAWVRNGVSAISAGEVGTLKTLPSETDQLARAEFGLAQFLARRGRQDAAELHFQRAGTLAPHDFTIRRGSMPMRGIDPMGPEFRAMVGDWIASGHRYYNPLPR